jgi:hypothetical protein
MLSPPSLGSKTAEKHGGRIDVPTGLGFVSNPRPAAATPPAHTQAWIESVEVLAAGGASRRSRSVVPHNKRPVFGDYAFPVNFILNQADARKQEAVHRFGWNVPSFGGHEVERFCGDELV